MKTASLITPGTSAGANVTSAAADLGDLTTFSVQVVFSAGAGDLVGTLTLEASNDGTNYVTVSSSSQAVTASANHVWNVTQAGYKKVRCKWVYTSGTGNLTATYIAKENRVVGA